ncbi:MAG TPA: DoxX family protein [Nitriliruptorales bacterium]|nr:DoxX family protein [Nitriliruptorales bacterium]
MEHVARNVDGGGPDLPLRLGRLLLSVIFIAGGLDAVRQPEPKMPKIHDADLPVPRPTLTTQLNGAAMVAAGSALALGIRPKIAASVLAVSLVPTTIVGHPFWKIEDEQAAAMQQIQFMKNLGLLGGLMGVIASEG